MIFNDAARIRVIRAMTGMDSQTFAKRLGVCAGTITAWEREHTAPDVVNRQKLGELCQELGIGFTPSGFPFPVADCVIFKGEPECQK